MVVNMTVDNNKIKIPSISERKVIVGNFITGFKEAEMAMKESLTCSDKRLLKTLPV